MAVSRKDLVISICSHLRDATMDEVDIAHRFVAKLMGEGRREHGPLDLSQDSRDLIHEAKDELDDAISYLIMHRTRMEKYE